jgi:hypothetical protein
VGWRILGIVGFVGGGIAWWMTRVDGWDPLGKMDEAATIKNAVAAQTALLASGLGAMVYLMASLCAMVKGSEPRS